MATLDDPRGSSFRDSHRDPQHPRGLRVSIPICARRRATAETAFRWALLIRCLEIVGALLGWALLKDHFDNLLYGIVFGLVAEA